MVDVTVSPSGFGTGWWQGEAGAGLTGVKGVRLQAVDHVVVGFEQHQVLGGVSVPDEDVAAVGAAHHKVVAPETRLLYLRVKKMKEMTKIHFFYLLISELANFFYKKLKSYFKRNCHKVSKLL